MVEHLSRWSQPRTQLISIWGWLGQNQGGGRTSKSCKCIIITIIVIVIVIIYLVNHFHGSCKSIYIITLYNIVDCQTVYLSIYSRVLHNQWLTWYSRGADSWLVMMRTSSLWTKSFCGATSDHLWSDMKTWAWYRVIIHLGSWLANVWLAATVVTL